MTILRRYQVFVSSTFQDLKTERQLALGKLIKLDAIPAGMEFFPAASGDPLQYIKRVIDQSDHYLLIVANRYGSIHSSAPGLAPQ